MIFSMEYDTTHSLQRILYTSFFNFIPIADAAWENSLESHYIMNIAIRYWFGRLGNNIMQVYNAICIAKYYNYNVEIWEPHPFFPSGYLTINPAFGKEAPKLFSPNSTEFFSYPDSDMIQHSFSEADFADIRKILCSIFQYPPERQIGPNDLVIHIRGGDIFSHNPHSGYVTPPLSFYVDILQSNHFDKVYLVSEDNKNPCIEPLLRQFPNIEFQSKSLHEDVALILGAKNVMSSFGTMIAAILCVSNNIETWYRASYDVKIRMLRCRMIETNLDEYHAKQLPWTANREQIERMLST